MESELQQHALRDLARKYDEFAESVAVDKGGILSKTSTSRAGELRLIAAKLRLEAEHLADLKESEVTPARLEVINRQIEMQNITYDELVDIDGSVAKHERSRRRWRSTSIALVGLSLGILLFQIVNFAMKVGATP